MILRFKQWVPRYLNNVDFLPGHKVSSDEWNALFNLSRAQGNNNADGIKLLMETVGDSIELPSILDSYSERISEAEESVQKLSQQVSSFDNKFTEEYISGIISNTYVTKTELETESHKISTLTEKVNTVEEKVTDEAITSLVSSSFYKKTEVDGKLLEQSEELTSTFTQQADSISASVSDLTDRLNEAELELTADRLIAKVSTAYATKETVEGIDQKVTTLTENIENVELQLTADAILSKVSDVLVTKEEVNALEDELDNLTARVESNESSIEQTSDSIHLVVSRTEKIEKDYINKANVQDYIPEASPNVRIYSSRGTVFKNDSIPTVLSVTVFKGGDRITNIEALKTAYGPTVYLQWSWIKGNDTGIILNTDSRLSNDGFSFTISPDDVNDTILIQCDVITD